MTLQLLAILVLFKTVYWKSRIIGESAGHVGSLNLFGKIFFFAETYVFVRIITRNITTTPESRRRWMLWGWWVFCIDSESLSIILFSLEINPHPSCLTWAKTTAMQWSAKINNSRNVLRVLSLEEETTCRTEIVLAIGEPGVRSPRLGLRRRPPRPPLPPPRSGCRVRDCVDEKVLNYLPCPCDCFICFCSTVLALSCMWRWWKMLKKEV